MKRSFSHRFLQSYSHLTGLGFILLLALGLRLYHLGKADLWTDELGQAIAASAALPRVLFMVQKHHGAAPLDYLITMIPVRWSHDAGVLRMPAALWGTLTVYWIYRLGRLIQNRRVGLLAAALAMPHVFLLRYAQELRFYALFVLLGLITTELLWRAWLRSSRRAWGIYGISVALLLYTHYFGVLMIGLHGLWVASMGLRMRRKEINQSSRIFKQQIRFLVAVSVAFLLFLPWILYDLPREQGVPSVPPTAWSWQWLVDLLRIAGGRNPFWWIWLPFAAIGLLLAFRRSWPLGLMFGAMFALPPLIMEVDRLGHYFFHPRQIIFLIPFYVLLTAWGIDGAAGRIANFVSATGRDEWRQGMAWGVVGLLVVLNVPVLKTYYDIKQLRREDIAYQPLTDVMGWRGAAEFVAANWQEGDALIYLVKYDSPNVRFYLPAELKDKGVVVRNLDELEQQYAQGRPVWIVHTFLIGRTAESSAMQTWLKQRPAIHLLLPGNVHVYFLQKGYSVANLWQRRFYHASIPDIAYLWAAFGRAARAQDHEIALHAFAKAASLSGYTRPRMDYFAPSEYAGAASDAPSEKVIVETRADYLVEAAHEALTLQRTDEALAYLDQALLLDPTHPGALIHKGWALLQAGRADEAIQTLRYARDELDVQDAWLDIFLGNAYIRLEKYPQAIEAYQDGLRINPDLHRIRFLIASAYQAMGDDAMARVWYDDYLAHAPEGPLAQQAHQRLQALPQE